MRISSILESAINQYINIFGSIKYLKFEYLRVHEAKYIKGNSIVLGCVSRERI